MASSEVTFKCKYCRKMTNHIPTSQTEIQGYKGLIVKCMVCGYEAAVYRRKGRLDVDQSNIPERSIIMIWDDEYTQMKHDLDAPDAIQANKDIDDWLTHPVGYFPGFGKRGRWKLDINNVKSEEK